MRLFKSVRSRIYGAFGAMTIIVVLIGGTASALMMNAEHLFGEYRHHARQSLAIDEYLRDVAALRIDFLNYLLHPSADWERKVHEMVEEVGTTTPEELTLFEGEAETLAEIAEVTDLAHSYGEGFDAIVAGVARGVDPNTMPQTTTLTTIGPRMYELYAGMSSRAHDAQNALGPRIAQQEQLQLMLMAAISVIGLIIGVVLALVTSRWLAGTFTRLTQTMRHLAGGDYEIAIDGTTTQNELGEMARALETFRVNGQQVALAEVEKEARADEIAARAAMMQRFQSACDTVIGQATEGDFNGRIDDQFGDPEIDRIADNLNGMLGTIQQALSEAERVLGALAQADLRDRMAGAYQGAFAKLKSSTNSVADKLEEIVTELRDTSGALKLATGEILAGANDLSERSTKQASTIEETAAAMEQMANTVTLNAERARDASTGAERMTTIVEAGSEIMSQATEAMDRISTSSSKISNIIGLIDDIAFQTNLLALNASVEAARAGEAGNGFAVVAVEVRRLAQSAAQASSDIKALIEQSSTEVRNGARLVSDVAGRLTEIIDHVRTSASLMESIAGDSRSQADGIGEVNIAVRQMDEMTQHNAALVEEMNASIEQTEGQASRLDGIVETFTLNERGRAAARSAPSAPAQPTGARGMLKKVQTAAQAYFGGAAATKEDWAEF
ncbi:methyl-accepting chemotaxis protein [Devosia epidermidihirudinis]|uniref:methyl-accepting chemotaxis protein n=1 Tax=Devosia epidermidihirudinis TaxID=1293439 RepID=UPI0009E466F5|nr:methyl-accepting chemotaxis protein [Devosia epidermidihirudinis]